VIRALSITIILEGAVGLGYSNWRKKPVLSIFITSVIANLITQSLLWIALNMFFQHYLLVLSVAEILIWLVESLIFHGFRPNHLGVGESLFFSLIINLSSFGLGLLLPI
jgi:hypothetical protein